MKRSTSRRRVAGRFRFAGAGARMRLQSANADLCNTIPQTLGVASNLLVRQTLVESASSGPCDVGRSALPRSWNWAGSSNTRWTHENRRR